MAEKLDWGEHCIEPVFLAGWDSHPGLDSAEAYCRKIATAHYENFIIASKFTPAHIRQHIENIYAFCRYGDDLGDEAPFPNDQRTILLDAWEADLEEAARADWSGDPRHPILVAIQHTSKEFSIPVEPYWKLIQAFKMDQVKTRYENWQELKEYCTLSADPVGHLFLYVYGHDDEEMRKISDNTCTALQLANHWQDIARDWQQNRSYMPEDTMAKFSVDWQIYGRCKASAEWREMLAFEVERAQRLFDAGRPLWQMVDAHLAVDLMMFTKGGEAILASIRAQDYDTWSKRPTVSKFKQIRLYLQARRQWRRANKRQR